MIIFPAIDLRNGRVVRLVEGDFKRETVYAEDPSAIAEQFRDAGAEFLHVVDLDGALAGESRNLEAIRKISANSSRDRRWQALMPKMGKLRWKAGAFPAV